SSTGKGREVMIYSVTASSSVIEDEIEMLKCWREERIWEESKQGSPSELSSNSAKRA
ncbi:hypothetical protein A2U01_0026308, partial [Trifolium medium]|nr:hypothetical protein [Trifolium medium]